MLTNESKMLVHFDTSSIRVYQFKAGCLNKLSEEQVNFKVKSKMDELLERLDCELFNLEKVYKEVSNECVRLYATGVFQQLTTEEQNFLVTNIYVNHGLLFNIVSTELEQFYLGKSQSICESSEMIDGLFVQEFRKVVICGSFQQHLEEIGELRERLQKRNVTVLSPWTTKVIPESLGTDFILLEGQEPLKNERDAWRHKFEHMEKFRQSDAVIVCNPDGLIGRGTLFELGFMIAISKRIILTEKPKNLNIPFPYEVGVNFV